MKRYIILILSIFVYSCSSNVKSEWSCPVLEGGKGSCVSIQEADVKGLQAISTNGGSNNFSYVDSEQEIEINLVAPKVSKLEDVYGKSFWKKGELKSNQRFRTEEKIGRVWFASYIDSRGNRHEESIVYVVDEKPQWISKR